MKELIVYSDGSYTPKAKGYVGVGIVFIENDEVINKMSFYKENELADKLRNVVGELYGAMQSILYAHENGYDKVIIHVDYQGCLAWFEGSWKCKNEITSKYRDFCIEMSKLIDIEFIKVKGHSGNEYNEVADKLAKEAIKPFIKD